MSVYACLEVEAEKVRLTARIERDEVVRVGDPRPYQLAVLSHGVDSTGLHLQLSRIFHSKVISTRTCFPVRLG